MLYVPGGKPWIVKAPAWSVVALLCLPSVPVTVTVACGMTAPVWSVTLPLREADGVCARVAAHSETNTKIKIQTEKILLIFPWQNVAWQNSGAGRCTDYSPPAPAGAFRFHVERMVEALGPAGAAVRIGSTPASKVISAGPQAALPSVATTITAAPWF